MAYYSAFDVCAQIRQDWAEARMDAGPSKKCPGGYSIPADKKCGGADERAMNRVGRAGKKAYDMAKKSRGVLAKKGQSAVQALGGPMGAVGASIRQSGPGKELNARIQGARASLSQARKEVASRRKADS